jgi:hypothetical protein
MAQSTVTGELVGTVTDPSNAVVVSAKVTLTSDASGGVQTLSTNSVGEFHFSLLRPGVYTVTVDATGFDKQEQKVTVGLGQVANAKIQLGLAKGAESVTVVEQSSMMQTDNANLATTFDASQLANLPAPGNDMTAYALTAPGVTVSTGGGYGNFTVFGLPGVSNLFTINGTDNMDPYLNLNNSGASNLTLGSNEILEAAVIINGYTGQYGRQAGAQVNYVTKSGANAFHGNAAFYYNEKVLNANDFFNNNQDTPRPFAISRQWAGSIGGRIIKNKLFFFYNNEGMRYVLPSGGPVYIPTSDFSTYVLNNLKANNAPAVGLYTTAFNLYSTSSGASRARPFTVADDAALGCGDFAGTAGWGVTKPCASVFQSSVNNLNIERLQAIRVDYNFSPSDRLYVRYNDDHGVQATSTDPINSAFSANSVQPSYGGQIGYTRVITPSMVNQLLLSTSYYTAIFGPPNFAGAVSTFPTTFGFSDGAPFNDMGGTDSSYPAGRKVRQYQIIDDYSIAHGTHTIKAGMNYRLNYVNTYATLPDTTGLVTFNSMTDFVNGSLSNGSTYTQNFPNVGAEPLRMYSLGFYLQDEWKAKSNLTFTLALRLDRNSNITCGSACFNEFGTPFAGVTHTASTPYNASIHAFSTAFPGVQSMVASPRIGMAYTATKTTVIRGGFGIFTDLYQGLIADRFVTNSPAVTSFTTQSGLVALNNPNSVFAAVANSNAAFRSGYASGATLAQLQSSVPLGFAAPTFSTVENKLLNPKYYEWNLEVQQTLTANFMLSLNYVGNHGVDEINQNPLINGYSPAGFQGMPTTAPDPRFGQVRELVSNGYSYYDGLVASFKWHLGHQFTGQFNFDYGHALDTCSNSCLEPFNAITAVSVRNQLSPVGLSFPNYGAADYDTRHNVNSNFLYTVPGHLGNKVLNSALSGWTLAGTILFHSGYPFSVVNSSVRSQVKNVTGITSAVVLTDYISSTAYPSCTTPDTLCFSKSLFATAANQHDWGNIPRNSFRGPGYFDTDINVAKVFAVHERYQLKVGAYFFNILNHPNFDLPGNNLASGNFGQILNSVSPPSSAYGSFQGSAVSGRLVQLLVKFQF